jgi:PKD repeat protein
MVAIGNFKQVNGITHDQIVRINLNTDAAVVDDSWNTTVFTTACSSSAFDSWVRDVSYSPDGSYFVVVGTGGPHPGQYCDAAIRFETPSTGTTVAPTWADWTGGDSLWSVAVTGTAVYVGGHQRWLNNPNGTDSAQAGAVPRPGLGALDPITGIPLSWNPGRNPRGAGAWAVLATPAGLWVGSDTEWIGNFLYHRKRIAFFPLSSGLPTALGNPGALPNDIFKLGQYSGGTYTNGLSSINFNGTTAGDPFTPASTGITWGSARAAVQIDGKVLFGWSDGTLHVRSFDGTGWGPDQIVDPYNDPYWSSVATGSGQTYKGVRPAFYSLIPNLTSMFYWNNRLYYTRSGNNGLWYRMFNPDSYIMGAQEFTAGSLGVRRVGIAGAFVGGGNVYWANPSDGTLHAMSFTSGVPSGTDQVVSGPSIDGFDWRARGLFISPQAPHGPNQPPTARIIANCSHSTCGFDGTTSSDPESGPLTYSWNLGDGTTSTSPSLTHDYATPGTYTVTLTVTDNRGQTGTATQPVTTTAAAPITFLGASHFDKAATLGSVTVPAGVQAGDALLMFVSVNNGTSAVTPPGGWQLVGTENTPTTSPVLVTQVYSRVAGASDAGQPVNVTLSATAKLDMQLLAYHNTDPTTPVQTSAFRADTASTATHVTPAVTVSGAGALPVSYWVDKSSTTTSWTTPAGLTLRDTALDTGAGYLTSVVADPNVAVAPGTYAGQTATTDVAGSKANMWTVVLNPTP